MNQHGSVILLLCLGLLSLVAVGAALGDVQTTESEMFDTHSGEFLPVDDVEYLPADTPETEGVETGVEIDDELRSADGSVEVIVSLSESDQTTSVETLQAHASDTQQSLVAFARDRPGVTVENRFWLTNAVVVSVDTDRLSLRELASVRHVDALRANVEVEAHRTSAATPANSTADGPTTMADTTWGLSQIGAPEVWETYGTQGEGTTVTVLDTGVDASHPDLNVSAWAEFDRSGDQVDSAPYDSGTHGTHTSGTVAGGNESGVQIGVAPGTELHHGGVLTDEGGSFGSVIGGMEWAVANDADVVSMSLGATGHIDSMIDPVRNAEAAGTTVVASVGNSDEGSSSTPGNTYDGIGVGALKPSGEIASFSSGEVIDTDSAWYGAPSDWPAEYVAPTVAAPGWYIKSTWPDGEYYNNYGTSMAAPHVAGAVALIESAVDYDPSPAEIKGALEATATKPDDVGTPPGERDTRYGSGIIDVPAAIEYLSTPGSAAFQVDIVSTNEPVVAGSTLDVSVAVTNTGDAAGTESMTLTAGALGETSTTVDLGAGDTVEQTLSVGTAGGDAGTYTATATTPDDTAGASVTVLEPATFAVTSLSATNPVEGEDIAVEFTAENTGDVDGTETVTLSTDLNRDQNSTELTLVGGESATRTLSVGTASGDSGSYTVTVASEDDTNSTGVTVQKPAQFAVNITGTDSPVVEGEPLSVDATIENIGDVADTQTVTLDAGNLGTDGTSVSLAGGESTGLSLTLDASSGDAGSYTASVASADDADSTAVTVQEPASFAVGITGANSPVVTGDSLSVEATVENTGDVGDTQTLTLDAGGLGTDSTTLSLTGGESTAVTLSVDTAGGDAGNYTVTVASADSSDSTGVTVQASGALTVALSGTNTPVVEGEMLSVEATVENTGDVSDTQTIALDAGGLGTDSTAVSLAGGESTALTLSVDTGSGDAGTYTATVSGADDAGNTTVSVQEPAYFAVGIDGINSPVVAGETLTVDAAVENTGDVADTQTVTLDAGSLGGTSTTTTLAGGETVTETLSLATGAGDAGEYTVTVGSADETASAVATVLQPAAFTVDIVETTSPVEGDR
ncbi:S8 family serine peptidase, partial [Halorientalis sp.]|uniref:S8 family serine peptidase n=1 Tax=Halorientalis sp. TaxID=1931229 RepID=UPI0026177CEA